MPDVATIGSMVALAMSMAAEAALKGTVTEAVKDAYKALKGRLIPIAEIDVRALESTPDSAARQGVIAELVNHLPEPQLDQLKPLVEHLAAALKRDAGDGPVGLDIGTLEGANLILDSLRVHAGTGMRADKVTLTGDLKIGPMEVGKGKK